LNLSGQAARREFPMSRRDISMRRSGGRRGQPPLKDPDDEEFGEEEELDEDFESGDDDPEAPFPPLRSEEPPGKFGD